MKKYITKFLILLLLAFNIFFSNIAHANVVFSEGVYNLADYNISPTKKYTVKNISSTSNSYIIVFNNNKLKIAGFDLKANSETFLLPTLHTDYTFVVVGNGNIVLE